MLYVLDIYNRITAVGERQASEVQGRKNRFKSRTRIKKKREKDEGGMEGGRKGSIAGQE